MVKTFSPRVGHFYKTRSGETVGPLRRYGSGFRVKNSLLRWFANGSLNCDYPHCTLTEHLADLVEELETSVYGEAI